MLKWRPNPYPCPIPIIDYFEIWNVVNHSVLQCDWKRLEMVHGDTSLNVTYILRRNLRPVVTGCGEIRLCGVFIGMDSAVQIWSRLKITSQQPIHYRVHKSPPSTVPYPEPHHPILYISHLLLGHPSGLLPSRFLTNILHVFLFSPCVLHSCPSSFFTWSLSLYL
jgi:hypothetical protein